MDGESRGRWGGAVNLLKWLAVILGPVAILAFATRFQSAPPPDGHPHQSPAVGMTQHDMTMVGRALDAFRGDFGRYPTNSEGLVVLLRPPAGAQDAYLSEIPHDQWGHAFVYRCGTSDGQRGYRLISAGPDGRLGTDDDITDEEPDFPIPVPLIDYH